jgi:hypothetical protein
VKVAASRVSAEKAGVRRAIVPIAWRGAAVETLRGLGVISEILPMGYVRPHGGVPLAQRAYLVQFPRKSLDAAAEALPGLRRCANATTMPAIGDRLRGPCS